MSRGFGDMRFEAIARTLEDAGIEVAAAPVDTFDEMAIVAAIRKLADRYMIATSSNLRSQRLTRRLEWLLECSEKDVANEQRRRDEARADVESQAVRIFELEAELATLKGAKEVTP